MGGGMATATSSTIQTGTLAVDFYDPAQKQLIWRGSATKTLNPPKEPNKRQKNLDKAVAKLLKNFPPPPAKKNAPQNPERNRTARCSIATPATNREPRHAGSIVPATRCRHGCQGQTPQSCYARSTAPTLGLKFPQPATRSGAQMHQIRERFLHGLRLFHALALQMV